MTQRAQFQAVLAGQTVARTAHFVLHRKPLAPPPADALFAAPAATAAPDAPPLAWIGAMVPKRWARRAVTRNAIRRQIYALADQSLHRFGGNAHLVRLRAGFAKSEFPSATSPALKSAVRAELQQLFSRVQP